MKTITVHQWETRDPSIVFVEHAANRLASFKEPDDDVRAFNRVVKGNEFTERDIMETGIYLRTLAARSRIKWQRLMAGINPAAVESIKMAQEMESAVKEAALSAEEAAKELNTIFRQCKGQS